MKRLYSFIICTLLSPIAFALDLSAAWKDGSIWKIKRGLAGSSLYMRDTDETKSIAREGLTFGEMPLGEVIFEWKAGEQGTDAPPATPESAQPKPPVTPEAAQPKTPAKPSVLQRITASIYNRGDNGDISAKEFAAQQKELTETLTEFFGKKPKKGNAAANKTGLKINSLQWEDDNGVLRLESAMSAGKESGKQPEFIRIICSADKAELAKGGVADKVGRRDLRSSVVKEEDGTVWIKGIPMVDQGMKGYCVPATVARVFAYYGMDSVGMHELASICSSDSERGTNVYEMFDALKKIGSRYRVRIKWLSNPAGAHTDFIKEYNKEARAENLPTLPEGGHVPKWYLNIDGATWVKVRVKKATDVKKWFTPIRRNIDAGVPVIWSVFASGLHNREGQEGGGAGGGHMRLIIGYNDKEGTIVYSDSWGEWATKRIMTMAEAYSVTDGVCSLQP